MIVERESKHLPKQNCKILLRTVEQPLALMTSSNCFALQDISTVASPCLMHRNCHECKQQHIEIVCILPLGCAAEVAKEAPDPEEEGQHISQTPGFQKDLGASLTSNSCSAITGATLGALLSCHASSELVRLAASGTLDMYEIWMGPY